MTVADYVALAERSFATAPLNALDANLYGPTFIQLPPMQVSPMLQERPQLPQLLLSLMKDASFMHCPMHDVYPGAHTQEPPVQVSENEHWFPQRPQLEESLMKSMLSLHCP
jgi:hypothetical protein